MPLVLKDRVRETSITAGTGTLTLNGAVAGFQSFAFIGNTNTTYYAIVDVNAGNWEVGLGTYTALGTTLSRDSVLDSSAGGVRVNFSSSIKDVFSTYPAKQAVTLDDVQTLANKTISSPSLTGTPTAPTAAADTNTTQVATTAHVFAERTNTATLTNKTISSPSLTGTPTAPTAAAATNTTQVATTAHVFAERTNTATLANKTLTSPNLGTPTVLVGTNITGSAAGFTVGNVTGVVALVNGGTGTTTAAGARTALGSGTTGDALFLTSTAAGARTTIGAPDANLVTARTAATGSSVIPAGTTAQRDATPLQGFLRYNASIASFEGYSGTSWGSVGGGATGAAGDTVFQENSRIVTASYTISAGKNASLIGPLTVNSGVQVTVPTGARLVIF
jgi:hypothetical protein